MVALYRLADQSQAMVTNTEVSDEKIFPSDAIFEEIKERAKLVK